MSRARDEEARPTPHGLAGRLRALREATVPRISQTAAAQAIGSSQNRLSRAESGAHVLTPDEVRTLCRLYGAASAERRQLVEWAGAVARSTVDARVVLRRGGGTAAFQARIRTMEEGAVLIRAYQPGMILGPLQTEAYATVVFRGDRDAVRQRMLRSRALRDQEARRWRLVQPLGALLWNLGGHRTMAEQMEALVAVSRLPHVDLRIVTADREASFAVTHGFHVYDDNAAVVGVLTGTTVDTDRATIAEYVALHEQLVELSVGGDAARSAIMDVEAAYRRSS